MREGAKTLGPEVRVTEIRDTEIRDTEIRDTEITDPAITGTALAVSGLDDDGLFALADAVIDRLADMPAHRHGPRVRQLARLQTRVEALLTLEAGALDSTLEYQIDGRRSAAAWIATQTRMARPDAARLVHRARHLRQMPIFAPLHLAGMISTRHVDLATRTRRQMNHDDLFAEHEARLARTARDHAPEKLASALSQLEQVAETERQDPLDDGAAWDTGNHLDISEVLDRIGVLDGRFGPDGFAIVERAVRTARDRAHTEADPRTPGQQRGDALVQICQAYLQGRTGGSNRAHVLYHVDEATWSGTHIGLCETDRGTRLHPDAIRRHACDALIARVVYGTAGETLDHGRSTRNFTPAQYRALIATYPTCTFPGCAIESSGCEMHHITWWEHNGPTDLANGAPVCYLHHHHLHEGRYTITRTKDATITWHRPDGTEFGSTPPRARTEPIALRRPPDPPQTQTQTRPADRRIERLRQRLRTHPGRPQPDPAAWTRQRRHPPHDPRITYHPQARLIIEYDHNP